jgi:polyribonucleotide nucleotidyltransferase
MAATRDAIVMVEAGAKQVSEQVVNEELQRGHEAVIPVIDLQERLGERAGKEKRTFPLKTTPEDLVRTVKEFAGQRLHDHLVQPTKQQRQDEVDQIHDEVLAHFEEQGWEPADIEDAFGSLEKETVRDMILKENIRPDGRARTEIRPLSIEVGVVPRVHGSGLFSRGQTQALTITTLGSPDEEQIIDGLGPNESKRYLHHYNFPPFSTGETRPVRSPGRREIGHGMLAERALEAVLPSKEEFPYTIRLVSEILSSNGSTSMAATTGSTLALMDAGVPISAPVSGIAMGLITGKAGEYAILTDIQGVEDHLGDMDFKVTGTRDGVTAIQMDIKVSGLTKEIMEEALEQARAARLFILDRMQEVLPEPRTSLSPFAPRITRIQINPDKIGTVIGPGGKMIKRIIEETKASIDIEDDGTVYVGSTSAESAEKAIDMIRALTEEVEVGKTYHGTVKRIMDFGAFVEILPNKEGLVHISQLAPQRVNRVEDVVNIGDQLDVKVTEIDSMGRINLSRRALLEPVGGNGSGDEGRGPRRDFRGGDRGGYRGDRGREGGRREGGYRGDGGQRGGGPRREGGFRRDQHHGGEGRRDRGEERRSDGPDRERPE